MTGTVVLSSDHAAIDLRRAVAKHIADAGWTVEDIGPTTPESTHYPQHGEAAADKILVQHLHDLVVHRAAGLRMRVQDQGDGCTGTGARGETAFKATLGSGKNHFWHETALSMIYYCTKGFRASLAPI